MIGSPNRRLILDLALFTALTFGLTWCLVGAYVIDAATATRVLGPMRLGAPAFYLAVYAPSLVGVILSALRYGPAGLKDLFGAVLRIRIGWPWMVVAGLGVPGLWLLGLLADAVAQGGVSGVDMRPLTVALPLLLIGGHLLRDPGALGEELGWRGFALPRLLQLFDARTAALLLGLVWAVWHLPAFYVSTLSQSHMNLPVFIAQVTAYSVFMTWIFVNARGSVLWAGIVPHMLFNAAPRAGLHLESWVIIAAAAVVLGLAGRHLTGLGRPAADLPQAHGLRDRRGDT